jgi:tRNA modification GTPase
MSKTSYRNVNIVAEMTPPGRGAVSAIRISGPDARSITEKIFNTRIEKPRYSYFVKCRQDDVLIVYYKATASYTGEDLCEIFCHGNPQIVSGIIDELLSDGTGYSTRMAGPGEFTKRAYLNGKMDLLQAESVAELINSNTTISINYNAKMLRGELSHILLSVKQSLMDLAVHSELEIDFEDEAEPIFSYDSACKIIKEKQLVINGICSGFATIERISKEHKVIIQGNVNVGKSTIFNRLLNMNRSITHHEPGTTRDYIEYSVIWDGIDLVLVDTAGFRTETNSKVESEGIARVKELIDGDSLIVEISDNEDHKFVYPGSIRVINKIDKFAATKNLSDTIYVSAIQNKNIDSIRKEILARISEKNKNIPNMGIAFLVTKRQKQELNELSTQLGELIKEIEAVKQVDVVSYRINKCIFQINKLLGLEHSADAVLDELFSKFCIGK